MVPDQPYKIESNRVIFSKIVDHEVPKHFGGLVTQMTQPVTLDFTNCEGFLSDWIRALEVLHTQHSVRFNVVGLDQNTEKSMDIMGVNPDFSKKEECKHDQVVLVRGKGAVVCQDCDEPVTIPKRTEHRKVHLICYEEYVDDFGCEIDNYVAAFYLNGEIGDFADWVEANSNTFAARWPRMSDGDKAELFANFLQLTAHEKLEIEEYTPDYGKLEARVDVLKAEHIEREERAKLKELQEKYPDA